MKTSYFIVKCEQEPKHKVLLMVYRPLTFIIQLGFFVPL